MMAADYYCALCYEEDYAKWPDTLGLSVLTDYPIGCEVRAIDGYPYKYTQIERTLSEEELTDFFDTTDSYAQFRKQFGESNAANIYYFYELPPENGKPRYLKLGVAGQRDEVYAANIVDDFGYIRTLWKKEK